MAQNGARNNGACNNGGKLGFEAERFKTADKPCGNMEPSDYKHVALGLIFLKYISDWGDDRLRDDPRWQFGVPPVGNANTAWLQHIHWHLAPFGTAGVVLANGSLGVRKIATFYEAAHELGGTP